MRSPSGTKSGKKAEGLTKKEKKKKKQPLVILLSSILKDRFLSAHALLDANKDLTDMCVNALR